MSEEATVSLAPGEEQMLTEIEDRLRRSDLKLAARLAIFRWSLNTSGPARERLSPWRARPAWAIRTALLTLLLCACAAAGLLMSGAA
jgi:Protein of unknown function (DUF3040)